MDSGNNIRKFLIDKRTEKLHASEKDKKDCFSELLNNK